ncbi:MAG TPA: hypothetical protein VMT17_20135 [Anaeromyxobacteraceae bacterium]|nr:hypothetical protein [Anaeromyxobacteraceae bacterium]
MPPAAPPAWVHVHRELQRARGARRLLPWAAGSAVVGYAFVSYASRSLRGGLPLLVAGAALSLLIGALGTPRCPACDKSLWIRGERPGPATAPRPTRVERDRRCPRCGTGFEGAGAQPPVRW